MTPVWLALVVMGCGPREASPEAVPPIRLAHSVKGPAGVAFGHAVGWVGNDVLVGAPLAKPGGRVYLGETPVIDGDSGAFVGSWFSAGPSPLISAPRAQGGAGAVLDPSGTVLLTGPEGAGLGGRPHRFGEQIASLGRGGLFLDDALVAIEPRLWSLTVLQHRGELHWVAGSDDGRLFAGDAETPESSTASEYGYALAACDLDADGEQELVVGDPGQRRVLVYRSLEAALERAEPTAALLGRLPRFGHAVACLGTALVVGAPGPETSGFTYFAAPLHDPSASRFYGETRPGAELGWAVAARGTGRFAVSAPGLGEVLLFDAAPTAN